MTWTVNREKTERRNELNLPQETGLQGVSYEQNGHGPQGTGRLWAGKKQFLVGFGVLGRQQGGVF